MLRTRARRAGLLMTTLLPVLLHCSLVEGQTPPPAFPDAKQSDPQANGLMQGFPPPPDKTVRFGDGSASKFPATRWSMNHLRELMPSVDVSRGEGPVAVRPREARGLGGAERASLEG